MVGLTSLETRRLRADMIEVYNILGGFERTNAVNFFQRRVGCTRGHYWKLFKKRVNLDARKFSFEIRVCDEWNKLQGWVVNVESVNNFKGNLYHYLRYNAGFK